MTALWRDDFSGSGAITVNMDGTSYTSVDAGWARSSGQAVCSTANQTIRWSVAATAFTISVQIPLNPTPAFQQATIYFRDDVAGNRYQLSTRDSHKYHFYKVVGGVATEEWNAGAVADGDVVQIRLDAAGLITVAVNGAIIGTFADAPGFGGNTMGLGTVTGTATVAFDNLVVRTIAPTPATWYTSPSATVFGAGDSVLDPFDIRTAATASVIVQPGDQVLGRQGQYLNSGDPNVIVTVGDGTNPVDFRRYPGDGWPRLMTGLQLTGATPGKVRFWLWQVRQDNVNRINNYRGDNPTYADGGIVLESPNCEFHYCVIANNAITAWFWGEQAYGSLVHMCMTYYNGFCDLFNGLPATQGFYRQTDDTGTGLFQVMDTCITCLNYQSGMQIYGSGLAHLKSAKTNNSLFFYGGFLGSTYSAGQAIREILLGSTSTFVHADQIYFDKNWLWPQPNTSAAQLGYNGQDNTFVSWTNNVVLDAFEIQYFRNLESTGNIHVQQVFNGFVDHIIYDSTIGALPIPAGGGIDNNSFYVANDGDRANHGPFIYQDGISDHRSLTLAQWFVATGFEQHSTLDIPSNAPTMTTVKPNTVEPTAMWPTPRAYMFAFNFQALPSGTFNVSSCLNVGDYYAVYDWGTFELDNPLPIATGQYMGGSITLPFGIQTAPVLIADPTGARSKHPDVPILNVGSGAMPGAYVLAQVPQPPAPSLQYRYDRNDYAGDTGLWGEPLF